MDKKNIRNSKESTEGVNSAGPLWTRRSLAGVIVILIGIGLLLKNIFHWFSFNYVWPVLIIVVGLYLLVKR